MAKHVTFSPTISDTHVVTNQPSPLENYNAFESDEVLQHWIDTFGGSWGKEKLSKYGDLVGGKLLADGFEANKHKPEFASHNRFGHRVDLVTFHPSYHTLMHEAISAEHHSLPWNNSKKGAHVVRAGIEFLHTQADPGTGCPLTMTFASVPAIKHQPTLAKEWLPKITSTTYDPRNIPFYEKSGLTVGMAMTEKQGGSDVRANTTRAVQVGEDKGVATFELVGHKWFCSAPMCDAFFVLAYTEIGLSCFFLPRWKPDGTKNPMHIQRLKNKIANVSNASSEVEFRGAFAWLVGEQGRGINTILDMVAMTRFDCMVGSSSIMSLAIQQALHHTGERYAFGKNLHQQPLMQNVLADLAIEAEAALAISMRMAKALDDGEHDFVRIGTAIGKYWICKRAPQHTYECMESIGAVALIADNVVARLYTESPVNAIWEGSGNVQCLDVLRTLRKEPLAVKAFIQELEQARNMNELYDEYFIKLETLLNNKKDLEFRARQIVEKMAMAWQAATLLLYGDGLIANSFIQSRLTGSGGHMYGTLDTSVNVAAIIGRAKPKLKPNTPEI